MIKQQSDLIDVKDILEINLDALSYALNIDNI